MDVMSSFRIGRSRFYHFMDAPDRLAASQRLDFWLDACDRLDLPEFESCRKTLVNWRPYILNAFDFCLSNGFTEGCNNAIKTLKRVAFGFRKRILHRALTPTFDKAKDFGF